MLIAYAEMFERGASAVSHRSPWLMYALVWVSGGLFAWVWLFMLMQGVNNLEGRRVFAVRPLAAVMIAALLAYFWLIFGPSTPGTAPGMSSARISLILLLAGAFLVFQIAIPILLQRHIKTALERDFSALDSFYIALLTLLVFLSLAIVQRNFNILVDKKSGEP